MAKNPNVKKYGICDKLLIGVMIKDKIKAVIKFDSKLVLTLKILANILLLIQQTEIMRIVETPKLINPKGISPKKLNIPATSRKNNNT